MFNFTTVVNHVQAYTWPACWKIVKLYIFSPKKTPKKQSAFGEAQPRNAENISKRKTRQGL